MTVNGRLHRSHERQILWNADALLDGSGNVRYAKFLPCLALAPHAPRGLPDLVENLKVKDFIDRHDESGIA